MTTNIYSKLLSVQAELKAPKTQYNSFGKYSYRSCEDILEALKPLLEKYKATVIISDEIVSIEGRFYIKSTVKFIDVESEKEIENSALAREEEIKKGMDGSQITGGASSYARKYALNGLFCIDDTKDADGTNTHDKDDTTNNDSNLKRENKKNENKQSKSSGKKCEKCNIDVTDKVAMWSSSNYKKVLCMKCQKEEAKKKS